MFQLVSVVEQTVLGLTWSETPKTGFLTSRPILFLLQFTPNMITVVWYFSFKEIVNSTKGVNCLIDVLLKCPLLQIFKIPFVY